MDVEIELKLFVTDELNSVVESSFVDDIRRRWPAKVNETQSKLYNQYFDTQERDFRRMDMGLRIRSNGGHFEQTIKTSGKVVGGLHSRPEYNVTLEQPDVDLSSFPKKIWPEDANLSELQSGLRELFSTDFNRHQYEFCFDDGAVIEFVCDVGEIRAGAHCQPIREIELELKAGPAERLFDIADMLADRFSVRVGNQSKAARGYLLASGQEESPKKMINFLPISEGTSCEEGFVQAVEYALSYWQHHEHCYLANSRTKSLAPMHRGMVLLLQNNHSLPSAVAMRRLTDTTQTTNGQVGRLELAGRLPESERAQI